MARDQQAERERGRNFVRIALWLMVLASVFVIASYWVTRGADRLPAQVVRFFLTLALAYQVWMGERWARWLTVALLSVACVWSLSSVFTWLVLGLPYAAAVGLLATRGAGTFLMEQKRRRAKARAP